MAAGEAVDEVEMVAVVAVERRLGNRRPVLRRLLTGLVEHLLLLQRIRDHRRLPSEVEVLADRACTEGGIIVLVSSLLKLITQAIVALIGVIEVQAMGRELLRMIVNGRTYASPSSS